MVRRFAAWSVVVSFLVVWAVPALAQQSPNASPKPSSKAEAKADAVVNLNTASVADLESLPGIGKSTAQRIVEYRQKSGGFKKIEDIMKSAILSRFVGVCAQQRLSGGLLQSREVSVNRSVCHEWWARRWALRTVVSRGVNAVEQESSSAANLSTKPDQFQTGTSGTGWPIDVKDCFVLTKLSSTHQAC
jgi:competence ComEA-like helix-hairpin-helix protein